VKGDRLRAESEYALADNMLLLDPSLAVLCVSLSVDDSLTCFDEGEMLIFPAETSMSTAAFTGVRKGRQAACRAGPEVCARTASRVLRCQVNGEEQQVSVSVVVSSQETSARGRRRSRKSVFEEAYYTPWKRDRA